MKKIILLLIIPFLGLVISSCDSSNDPMTPVITKGNIYITSSPAGAQIWVDGVNTSLTTPDTVINIEEGVREHNFKVARLQRHNYRYQCYCGADKCTWANCSCFRFYTTLHGPVKIYESFGTSAAQPSGLDLSTGNAWGISSDSSGVVDIYFYSDQGGNSYLIQSADLAGLIRQTDFFVGSSTNLYDEEDSPIRNNTWASSIDEAEDNYVFLYDHDGHYSKFKIVNRGGGTGLGDPAWVNVQWYYNNAAQDERF